MTELELVELAWIEADTDCDPVLIAEVVSAFVLIVEDCLDDRAADDELLSGLIAEDVDA